MAIKELKRIENYFTGFKKARADSIDSQFNMIVKYLNNEIVTTLKRLSNDKIPGSVVPSDVGKFLRNVGDGSTHWDEINNDSFSSYSLALSKLIKINASSVLAYDENQMLKDITPIGDNQALVARLNKVPIWKKLKADNLADRTIKGSNVADGTITNRNLPAYLIETLIGDGTITGNKFKNDSITSIKIADKTLSAEKLSPALAAEFPNKVWPNIIPNGYLKDATKVIESSYTTGSIDRTRLMRVINPKGTHALPSMQGSSVYTSINTVLPLTKFKGDFIPALVYGKIKSSIKLKLNDIDPNRVMIKATKGNFPNVTPFNFGWRRDLNSLLAAESVGLEHLTPKLRKKLLEAK